MVVAKRVFTIRALQSALPSQDAPHRYETMPLTSHEQRERVIDVHRPKNQAPQDHAVREGELCVVVDSRDVAIRECHQLPQAKVYREQSP